MANEETQQEDIKTRLYGTEVNRNDFSETYFELLPNPDLVLSKQNLSLQVYENLYYDPHIFAMIQARKSGVLGMLWDIDRGSEDNEITKFAKGFLEDLDMYRIFSEILNAPLFGYYPLEIYLAENLENKFVPIDIIGKPAHWFQYDKFGNLKFVAESATDGFVINPNKWLIVRYGATFSNPYGTSILSKCWWPQNFKSAAMKYWVQFTEKFGKPHLVAKTEFDTSSKADETNLMTVLSNLYNGGYAVLPEGASIDSVNPGNSFNIATYKDLIEFCNKEISKAMLSHSAAADSTPGRLGNENQSESAKELITLEQKRLVEYWINELIKRVVTWNYGEQEKFPVFELYDEEDFDTQIADRDVKLIATGQIKFTKEYWQETYGFKPEFFDVVDVASKPAAFTEPEKKDHKELAQIEKGGYDKFEEKADGMVNTVLNMIASGKDYKEMEKKLYETYDTDDSQVQEALAQAILIADAAGRISEENEHK